jgi:hypothetical protein
LPLRRSRHPAARTCSEHRLVQPQRPHRRQLADLGHQRVQPRLKGVVYVVNGTVARIRAVDPAGTWQRDDRGYADIPLTPPLTHLQVAEQSPAQGREQRASAASRSHGSARDHDPGRSRADETGSHTASRPSRADRKWPAL